MDALKASAGAAATPTPAQDPTSQLARFLHLVSQALRPSNADHTHLGVLIDFTV